MIVARFPRLLSHCSGGSSSNSMIPSSPPLTKFALEPQNLTALGNLLPGSHCAQGKKKFWIKTRNLPALHHALAGRHHLPSLSHVFTRRNDLKKTRKTVLLLTTRYPLLEDLKQLGAQLARARAGAGQRPCPRVHVAMKSDRNDGKTSFLLSFLYYLAKTG